MSTLGYRQGSGEVIPAIIHPSYVAGGQTWTVLSGVKKDVLNTVYLETSGMEEFHVRWFSPGVAAAGLSELSGAYPGWGEDT